MALVGLACFALASFFGIWDAIHDWLGSRWHAGEDEIYAAFAVASLVLAAFSVQRLRQLDREQRLRQTSEARYRTVVERVPAITYSWDPTRRAGGSAIRYVSPQIR